MCLETGLGLKLTKLVIIFSAKLIRLDKISFKKTKNKIKSNEATRMMSLMKTFHVIVANAATFDKDNYKHYSIIDFKKEVKYDKF